MAESTVRMAVERITLDLTEDEAMHLRHFLTPLRIEEYAKTEHPNQPKVRVEVEQLLAGVCATLHETLGNVLHMKVGTPVVVEKTAYAVAES